METNFEPGRVFANERDFQDQLDAWFVKVNARQHRSIRARPVDRLAEELEVMGALPAVAPDTDRRWVLASAPTPTFASTPATTRWIPTSSAAASRCASPTARSSAIVLDTGELACRHPRSFAQASHDHRARARPGAQAPPRRRRRSGADGADPLARSLRRADRMSRPTTELTHLFRQLKAPAAARGRCRSSPTAPAPRNGPMSSSPRSC